MRSGPGRRSRPASALPAGYNPREGGERSTNATPAIVARGSSPPGRGTWCHGGRTLPPGPRREDVPGGRLRQQRGPRRTHHRSPSACGVMVSSGLPRTPPGEPGRRAPSQRRPPPRPVRPRRTGAAPGTRLRPGPSTTPARTGAEAPAPRSAGPRARWRGPGPPPASRTAPRAPPPRRLAAGAHRGGGCAGEHGQGGCDGAPHGAPRRRCLLRRLRWTLAGDLVGESRHGEQHDGPEQRPADHRPADVHGDPLAQREHVHVTRPCTAGTPLFSFVALITGQSPESISRMPRPTSPWRRNLPSPAGTPCLAACPMCPAWRWRARHGLRRQLAVLFVHLPGSPMGHEDNRC